MLTDILQWLRPKIGVAQQAQHAGASFFEPLEPRVLLSADLAGVQPALANEAVPADPAIGVDLNGQGHQQQGLSPVLTLEASPGDGTSRQLGTTYSGGMDGPLVGPLALQDAMPPTIDSVTISPTSVILGGTFTISYKVSDSGGSGLNSIELWRTNDPKVLPGELRAQYFTTVPVDGPLSGDFSDTPPAAGDWWYSIRVFDMAGNSALLAQVDPVVVELPDTTPPSPDPSTWAVAPYATGTDSIRMVATAATDVSGVEYYFRETSTNPGATDSGWQDSNVYEDTGLSPSTTYTYQVMTRDKSPNQNQTQPTEPGSATTLADTTPPSPDPSTWALAPQATGATSVTMVATVAADPSGVEYYFDEISGNPGATDSGWQDSNVYEDTGLLLNTQYIYQVKTRDRSVNHNEGAYSTAASVVTPSAVYRFWSPTLQRHFYTIKEGEKNKLINSYSDVWTYEKVAYYAFAAATDPLAVPVYRFWSPTLQTHFYTIKPGERDKLISQYPDVWTSEGVAFYTYREDARPQGTSAVYRFWSTKLSAHFYTMSATERDKLINDPLQVWALELIAWYAYPAPIAPA